MEGDMLVAKKVDKNGNISDYTFATDDPNCADLEKALGGKYISHRIGNYDVLLGASGDALVIGRCPYIDEEPKRRESCSLSDEQVANIVQNARLLKSNTTS